MYSIKSHTITKSAAVSAARFWIVANLCGNPCPGRSKAPRIKCPAVLHGDVLAIGIVVVAMSRLRSGPFGDVDQTGPILPILIARGFCGCPTPARAMQILIDL